MEFCWWVGGGGGGEAQPRKRRPPQRTSPDFALTLNPDTAGPRRPAFGEGQNDVSDGLVASEGDVSFGPSPRLKRE